MSIEQTIIAIVDSRIKQIIPTSDLSNDTQLITKKEIAKMLAVGQTNLEKIICQPGFPPVIKIGERTHRWRHSAVKKWIDQQQYNSIN